MSATASPTRNRPCRKGKRLIEFVWDVMDRGFIVLEVCSGGSLMLSEIWCPMFSKICSPCVLRQASASALLHGPGERFFEHRLFENFAADFSHSMMICKY